jgi:hypothetical protein
VVTEGRLEDNLNDLNNRLHEYKEFNLKNQAMGSPVRKIILDHSNRIISQNESIR